MNKFKTFINLKIKGYKNWYAELCNEYQLPSKYRTIRLGFIDVTITGILVYFILAFINNHNKWLIPLRIIAIGLLAYLVQYYVSWLIKEIRGKS